MFHTARDAYPRGSTEANELQEFIPKLARFRASQPAARAPSDAQSSAAAALGIPTAYDPRYKVNASIRVAPASHLERAAGGRLPREAIDAYARLLPMYEDFYQKRHFAKLVKLAKEKSQLPIAAEYDAIVEAVRTHPVTLVAGDTGCGKSTQIPQYLMRAGFSKMACTQPRRISAVALARRVAYETLNEHGSEIAYKIRFDTTREAGTKVLFLTEGVLLRQLAADPALTAFDVVIVDEAHERHLNTDLLLGLLRGVIARRPQFRLVIMSATIDLNLFARYFGGCPVIQVPGRLHPIKVHWVPPKPKDQAAEQGGGRFIPPGATLAGGKSGGFRQRQERIDPHPYLLLLQRIDANYPKEQRGDLLVFLPGMAEIGAVAEHIRPYAAEHRQWVVLPLHSSLSAEEQDRVFDQAPDGMRKVILSTNVAETSVTIDGIRFVCDSGRHKEMLHNSTSGGGSLQEGWISQASAEQRKGRAGRTGPGVCFRFYSEADFSKFPKSTPPEIRRESLEGLVLQLKAIAGDNVNPRTFPWLEPPQREALEAAAWNLRDHGATTASETLTPLGALLASLPVDINVGKLLVLSSLFHLTGPAVTLAAALTVKSPFAQGTGTAGAAAARAARGEWESPHGDPFTVLRVFARWLQVRDNRRENSRRWCKRMGLEEQRLVEMAKLQRQFQDTINSSGLRAAEWGSDDERGEGIDEGYEYARGGPWGRSRERFSGRYGSRVAFRGGGGRSSRPKQRMLRDMQRRRDRERGRRVLEVDAEGDVVEDGEESDEDGDDAVGDRARFEDNLRALDLEVHVDLAAAQRAASNGELGRWELSLMKAILAQALYPKVALPDQGNASRQRESDWRFHTRGVRDVVLHPASALNDPQHAAAPTEAVLYGEMLETSRVFVCGTTRIPAHALLLSAALVECDAGADRLLIDRWFMLRVGTPGGGENLLLAASRLRLATQALLRRRLRRTQHGLRAVEALKPPEDLIAALASAPVPLSAKIIAEETVTAAASATGPQGARPEGVSGDFDENDVVPQDLAEDLAKFIEWPVRYEVQIMSKSALLRNLPPDRADPGQSAPDRDVSSRGGGGESGASSTTGETGASRPGVAVAPWLRWAALREVEDDLASHAVAPHLRRRWQCPKCKISMMAFFHEIDRHRATCGLPEDPAALPGSFGKDGRKGPSLQEELTGGANLGLPREALGLVSGGFALGISGGEGREGLGEEKERNEGGALADDVEGREFTCGTCGKTMTLSPTEILKHRRLCGKQAHG